MSTPVIAKQRSRKAAWNGFLAGVANHDNTEDPLAVELGYGISAQIMTITPELAKEWLQEKLQVQRNIRSSATGMLVRLINSDKWKLNGATIVFNDADPPELSDGQHRLTACVESDRPIISLVLWGVPTDAFWTMDTGVARNGADAIKALGHNNQTALSAGAQLFWRYDKGLPLKHGGDLRTSPVEIQEVITANPDLVDAVQYARPCSEIIRSQGAGVFCFCVLNRIDHDDAVEFFAKLASGENLIKGDPVLELRRRLTNRPPPLERIYLIFKAWNFFRSRKNVLALRVDMTQGFPAPI